MTWFTKKFLFAFDLKNVHATYFIAYVGIIVASLTSPTFGMQALGNILFWFGFICYAALFVLVTVRYIRHEVAAPAKPTFCVYAAPMSLSLAGYLAVTPEPNLALVAVMAIAAQMLFVFVLTQVPKFIKGGFYPSFAAMTFPSSSRQPPSIAWLPCWQAKALSCRRSSTGSSLQRLSSPPAWSSSSSPTTPASWGRTSSPPSAACAKKNASRAAEVEAGA